MFTSDAQTHAYRRLPQGPTANGVGVILCFRLLKLHSLVNASEGFVFWMLVLIYWLHCLTGRGINRKDNGHRVVSRLVDLVIDSICKLVWQYLVKG